MYSFLVYRGRKNVFLKRVKISTRNIWNFFDEEKFDGQFKAISILLQTMFSV